MEKGWNERRSRDAAGAPARERHETWIDPVDKLLARVGLAVSMTDAVRTITAGAVEINGEKVKDLAIPNTGVGQLPGNTLHFRARRFLKCAPGLRPCGTSVTRCIRTSPRA
jgi:hypothetical protein